MRAYDRWMRGKGERRGEGGESEETSRGEDVDRRACGRGKKKVENRGRKAKTGGEQKEGK